MAKQAINLKDRYLFPLLVILLVHLLLLVNLGFTAWPEMTLWPYLILKGWLPYRDIAIAHNPLVLVDLAIFYKFFGVSLSSLKAFTWILILMIDGLVYFVVKKLWDGKTALIAVVFYAFFQLFYEGNGLWFDLYLTFSSLLIFYSVKNKKYFWVGVWWALSFLVKQTAFWFLVPIGLSLLPIKSSKSIKKLLKGILVVFVPAVLIISYLGILPDYIYWAYEFGVGILPQSVGQVNLPGLKQLVTVLLPFSALAILLIYKKSKENWQLLIWSLFGLMGTLPRWELFHFQPALPYLAIAIAISLINFQKVKPTIKYLIVVYIIVVTLLIGRFTIRQWGGGDRFFEPEILDLANFIKDDIGQGEKIFILNAWDSVYVLSNTLPAVRPWVPHLPWYMGLPGIQEEIVKDLEISVPKMIVQGEYLQTGLGSYRPEIINDFIYDNYQIKDKIGNYLILFPKK